MDQSLWRRGLAANGADFELAALNLSPEYTDDDVLNAFRGQPPVTERMLPQILATYLSGIRTLRTPLVLLLGRHDMNVSSEVAAEWFATVHAPSKRLVWFERSAHQVASEEPEKLLMALVDYARPIAARVGDVAP